MVYKNPRDFFVIYKNSDWKSWMSVFQKIIFNKKKKKNWKTTYQNRFSKCLIPLCAVDEDF